jgi:L-ascorbate metabolism protein UlaG (beta-lactamase superfamily)
MANPYYRGPPSDHFDGARFFVPGEPPLGSPWRLLKWAFGGDPRAKWPASAPSPFGDKPPERVGRTAMRVTLIGHASFLIQVSGLNLLVDPVYAERASPFTSMGPKRVNQPGIVLDDLPPIDFVLVSHGHYDHLDQATLGQLHQRFAPRFLCPLGNDPIIRKAGSAARIDAFDWHHSFDAGQGVAVHFLPAFHWSARSFSDRGQQLWCAFLITSPAGTLYHIADTGYGDGRFFREAARDFGPIRLAHIPIGAYEPRWFMQPQHVNPEEAVRIFRDCGAETAIGHHWGTFQLTNEAHDQPPRDLEAALSEAGIDAARFQAFRPGQVWQG